MKHSNPKGESSNSRVNHGIFPSCYNFLILLLLHDFFVHLSNTSLVHRLRPFEILKNFYFLIFFNKKKIYELLLEDLMNNMVTKLRAQMPTTIRQMVSQTEVINQSSRTFYNTSLGKMCNRACDSACSIIFS